MIIPEKGFDNVDHLQLKEVNHIVYDANDNSNIARVECTAILKNSFMFNSTSTIGSVKEQYLMVLYSFSL